MGSTDKYDTFPILYIGTHNSLNVVLDINKAPKAINRQR